MKWTKEQVLKIKLVNNKLKLLKLLDASRNNKVVENQLLLKLTELLLKSLKLPKLNKN